FHVTGVQTCALPILKRDASISFKNTPIIQEGATAVPFVNRRELEESSKYLRKITSGDLGITVLKQDNHFYITLGGYKEVNNSGRSEERRVGKSRETE